MTGRLRGLGILFSIGGGLVPKISSVSHPLRIMSYLSIFDSSSSNGRLKEVVALQAPEFSI